MKKVNFFKVDELKAKEVMKGITVRSVANKNSMITFFEFSPNSIVSQHKHPHEQITVVTEGSLEMTIGGETKTLKVGEGVVIPPNLEHKAISSKQITKAFDTWYPLREGYL
ncbi:MAG: cupin domain-containing protein [Atribacterota bacterium]|nr:cupin domain-containing protein [Atribacterota bacterium]